MKRCKIRVEHSIYPPCKLQLRPGTMCLDILSYLGLTEDYVIYPLSDPSKTFTPEELVYDRLANDDKLIAKLSPEAERRYATLFMHKEKQV
jgi:hypothetical protein